MSTWLTFESFEPFAEDGLPHTEQGRHDGGSGQQMIGMKHDESAPVVDDAALDAGVVDHAVAEVQLVKEILNNPSS